jgi:hypothetical protein
MTPPRLEVAEVIRSCYEEFLQRFGKGLTPQQRRALVDLASCRTATLGGHLLECPQCGHRLIAYNSCGNRHCPKCQGTDAARWLETQAADLLPTPYFHVVFTLPRSLGPIALKNPRQVYGLLMRAAAETLLKLAVDPKHLGAKIGVLATLHTWGQNLQLHPHVHCVVTGGGLSPNESCWISGSDDFFLPFQVLSRVFRGKFLAGFRNLFKRGELHFADKLTMRSRLEQFNHLLSESVRSDWVVHVKPPWGGPKTVLKYLARYTHKTAISNRRLVSLQDGQVCFRWKDYAHGRQRRIKQLSATEFVRRFLMHVLPSGFVRVRHYGILANRLRQEKLALCRELLGIDPAFQDQEDAPAPLATPEHDSPVSPTMVCPVCRAGRMTVIEDFPPMTVNLEAVKQAKPCLTFDTS